ncbi:uncharacterized protein ARMOST_18709 [Armillaria ostoyae]|uniref:Uncharacterized protein n=1 Tax=Armillaria ostoyae TaxID=47428 RepID=A0A284S2H3_ARMOS|nr:uncharacterized protein ARMOST_18709 [Armillaria ostoyae]
MGGIGRRTCARWCRDLAACSGIGWVKDASENYVELGEVRRGISVERTRGVDGGPTFVENAVINIEARKRKDEHTAVHSTTDQDHRAIEGVTWAEKNESQPGLVRSNAEANDGREQHDVHTYNTGSLDDDESWVRSAHCE